MLFLSALSFEIIFVLLCIPQFYNGSITREMFELRWIKYLAIVGFFDALNGSFVLELRLFVMCSLSLRAVFLLFRHLVCLLSCAQPNLRPFAIRAQPSLRAHHPGAELFRAGQAIHAQATDRRPHCCVFRARRPRSHVSARRQWHVQRF